MHSEFCCMGLGKNHLKTHGAGVGVGVLFVTPLMKSLHVATVEVHHGLLLCGGERGLARDHQCVQPHRTLGAACIQVIHHLFKVTFGLGRKMKYHIKRETMSCKTVHTFGELIIINTV